MDKPEIGQMSATALTEAIRNGHVSSTAVTEFFIARIEEVNPKLNAVVIDFFDEARRRAAVADELLSRGETVGRLHGLPFTIKECFDYPDTPSTLGVLARRDDRPPATDAYVAAFEKAGGIVLGKTNVPQLMIFIEAINRVYGRTLNPLHDEFTCGGSSGGEGAIVGAGASPVGFGSDVGGSVRFPAAFCGVCSIKPTSTRFPDLTRYGATPLVGPITCSTGVIARHAEDLHLFLRVLEDEVGASAPDAEPLRDFNEVDVAGLHIGFYEDDGFFPPSDSIRRTIRETVAELRERGCNVTEFRPPNVERAEELFYRLMSIDEARLFRDVLGDEKPMPQLKNLFMLAGASPLKRRLMKTAAKLSGQKGVARIIDYVGAKLDELPALAKAVNDYRRQFLDAMQSARIDAIISPVAGVPGFPHDSTEFLGLGGSYTLLYNVLGFPSGVAQRSRVGDKEAVSRRRTGFDLQMRAAARAEAISVGLPLAVQIAAAPWREDIVIALINELHRRAK